MPGKLIILLFISLCPTLNAQVNNAIFNGGQGQGYDAMFNYAQNNNSIFAGADNDGFDQKESMSIQHNLIFYGGLDDGFQTGILYEISNNNIYDGAVDDGWSTTTFFVNQNNVIWIGGSNDGWSAVIRHFLINNIVFNGGDDDGFSNSGVSKMKWNGAISDEWLMAANWTPNIVPGKHDAAWIPQVKTHYPVLKTGMLGLSLQKNYSCKDLYIEPLASITLNQEVGLISNGHLGVEGTLNFLGIGVSNFEILEGATLDVKIGGLMNIVQP